MTPQLTAIEKGSIEVLYGELGIQIQDSMSPLYWPHDLIEELLRRIRDLETQLDAISERERADNEP
jgi:hypothetical protein